MRILKKIFLTILYLFFYILLIPFFYQLDNNYIWLGSITLLLIILLYFLFRGDKNKKCAWCGSRKINFKSGSQGDWYWEYRNKDGSRDKRVSGNFQQASYYSEYICKKCDAETHFNHFVNKKPSRYIKVWKRTLINNGMVDRTGCDWESTKGSSVYTNKANRKNN